MKRTHLLTSILPAILLASTAHAVKNPDAAVGDRTIEPAHSAPRRARLGSAKAPGATAAQALARFEARRGSWQVLWDRQTGVPTRLWGAGIDAPGASADPAIAERVARAVLAEELALLAPGARLDDLVVERNLVRAGVRSIWFEQRSQGLRVVGAGVRFTFKGDRLIAIGSTASPHVDVALPASTIASATASAKASAWITSSLGVTPRARGTAAAEILPIVRGKTIEHHVVVPVRVESTSPRADWTVWVDAATGAPVARRQNLLFGSGTVRYHVPDRYPQNGYQDLPAIFASHTVDGSAAMSDVAGLVSWASSVASSVTPGITGLYVNVQTGSGSPATATLSLADGGEVVWDASGDQLADAQLAAFVFTNIGKQYAINNLDPELAWLTQTIQVVVNEPDGTCNAYSNLDDIHFFPEGDGCGNTGRLEDVVYHELGHSLHAKAFGSDDIDGALSEGISDYFAATITNDHGMGKGFFLDQPAEALRDIDPSCSEYRWPDDLDFDTHMTGLIIAGALWDLRKAAVAEMGEEAGVAFADDVFYGIISRADDIESSWTEALITDDDDNDLSNGTPHECMLLQAFAPHGLVTGEHADFGQVSAPVIDGNTITLTQPEDLPDCPSGAHIESARLDWHVRGDTATGGTVDFTASGETLTAQIPTQADGTVVQFQLGYTLASGCTRTMPDNAADPWYEAYTGAVTEIYCTDFESADSVEGWTLTGFDRGALTDAGSADPLAAFSGTAVLGIDLGAGGDGNYENDVSYVATTPAIDVAGYTGVRLQYRRWLNAEDYFYDTSAISADGTELWQPLEGTGNLHMTDREWRFHDVDLSAAAEDGVVSVSFGLVADQGLTFGGWTIDDVCIVAEGGAPAGVCGDDSVDDDEACDDGNTVDGDGCSATCEVEGGDGGCCSTGKGGAGGPLALGLATLVTIVRRRRRRA